MNNEKCTKWLIEHGIKPTANRIVIARALASADRPMSMTELEESILTIDKSNIFRALTTFKEHHFFCECCHRTFCLEDTPIPAIDLPPGYRMTTINYIVKGLCPECGK